MISTKVIPIAKATSINVVSDDRTMFVQEPTGLSIESEPLRSASISLSIELAKKNMSLPEHQKPHTPIVIPTGNSLLQRMAHSPKAAVATFSTSVSANGNMMYHEPLCQQEEIDSRSTSAAIESLVKRIKEEEGTSLNATHQCSSVSTESSSSLSTPKISQQVDETDISKQDSTTCHKGFWAWLGFPVANNTKEKAKGVEGNTPSLATEPIQIPNAQGNKTVNSTASSSWSSFLFTTQATTIDKAQFKPEEASNILQKPLDFEEPSLRKVNKLPNSPIPNNRRFSVQQPIAIKAISLRHSVSVSSLDDPKPAKKKINKVLPLFESQFLRASPSLSPPSSPPKQPTCINLILTNLSNAFQSMMQQAQPPEGTSSWIEKRMKMKFSNFVEELKQAQQHEHQLIDKRIVIVGVHGWFPMKLVRSMIGEPTGTSIKFCEQMALGVRKYFEREHQVMLPLSAITVVPLEGEGKVEDRVNQLYAKLIENSEWLEAVSSADVVLWATHSQGTPVSVMLLQRLLERGHIQLIRQSLSVLAMAGISHGPFPALKGNLIVKYFEADAARELFEFMDHSSPISIKFRQSLEYILECGVKLVSTGSMQDQVVPLYSSIMHAVNHPNILRSIYIDGHIYSDDDFLIDLVVFGLKLRNAGLSDHDLLVHLSEVLAGNIYALEGGHSTIYEELEVYMTVIRYTFETAPFGDFIPTHCYPTKQPSTLAFQAKQQLNPFFLPWALRGIFTDPAISTHYSAELEQLLSLFRQWNPTSTRLKELKFRLEPLLTLPI
ncbi:hypothetical protein A0J61_08176 [Choanephora cucurbitarum]|uniref:YMC020W-like alpha/beta hydrolase domain-containing protein n=1 Tax=Choanephora cucurbitarum TaxID=101091 RepID=A0A1C7N3S7_9FUNG|nr:hypothetical protein A0J61_08176 [Choanephora cucurbitarum]